MKSLKILAVTGALVAVFALAGCQSHSSSSTSVEVTTTTESGTKTYSSSSETKDGVTTSKETTVETPANTSAQDEEFYNIDFHVEDDGKLTVSGAYSAEKWWKVVGNFNNVELLKESVENGNKYVANVCAMTESGQVQVIMAHGEAGKEEPVDYMVIAADVEGGKISTVDTSKSGVVQDLKTVFGDVEVTK
jgi:hypothetical protein